MSQVVRFRAVQGNWTRRKRQVGVKCSAIAATIRRQSVDRQSRFGKGYLHGQFPHQGCPPPDHPAIAGRTRRAHGGMMALPIEDQDTDPSQSAPAASSPTVAATLTMVGTPPEPAPAPERLKLLAAPAAAPSFALEIASRIASPEPVEDRGAPRSSKPTSALHHHASGSAHAFTRRRGGAGHGNVDAAAAEDSCAAVDGLSILAVGQSPLRPQRGSIRPDGPGVAERHLPDVARPCGARHDPHGPWLAHAGLARLEAMRQRPTIDRISELGLRIEWKP